MKRILKLLLLSSIILTLFSSAIFALNPFVTHIYTADPTARVFENRVYIYASHDKDDAGEYDMDDYHVFSSADLVHWVDHGVVFSYKDLEPIDENIDGIPDRYGWVEAPTDENPDVGSGPGKDWWDRRPCFWAPDCVAKWDPVDYKLKYYLYYPAQDYDVPTDKFPTGHTNPDGTPKENWRWNAFKIGVAVSDSPCGPFVPYEYPPGTQDPYGNTVNPYTGRAYVGQIYIPGSYSIDPTVLIDDDGRVYMIWGGISYGGINDQLEYDPGAGGDPVDTIPFDIGTGPRIAQLDPNTMATFITQPKEIRIYDENFEPNDGDYYEGPWIHKRNGIYYLSYPNPIGAEGSEMHYAMTEKADGIPLDDSLAVFWRTPTDINQPYDPNFNTNKILPSVGAGMTSHGSIVEYQGDWYVFYHNAEMAEREPANLINRKRSICVEELNYRSNGTIEETQLTRTGPKLAINPFSQIKAMLYSLMDGDNIRTVDCTGDDIGQAIGYIEDEDYIVFNNLDFGATGSNTFEARVSSGANGGTIEVWRIGDRGTTVIGTIDVPNTGGWENWITLDCDLNWTLSDTQHIMLKFIGDSGSLFNINWFKFKPATALPVGYSVAFKSQNPNCISNQGEGPGQMYLCVDSNYTTGGYPRLCANRSAVFGAWEKFSLLAKPIDSIYSGIVQLNSSNNGRKLRVFSPANFPSPPLILSDGGYYNSPVDSDETLYWEPQSDGTVALKSYSNNQYLCVDTRRWLGNDPAAVYPNRSAVGYDPNGLSWEKYYVEVADAPIGCVVAFKSLNPRYSIQQNPYLCVDSHNSEDLCVNRPAVAGAWEKFEVVDAYHGYIALKSLNNGQYLRFAYQNTPGNANGGSSINDIDDNARFQWRNNGDGTISLFNIGLEQYLNVDTNYGSYPAKVYCNQSFVIDWAQFHCQLVYGPPSAAGAVRVTEKYKDYTIAYEQTFIIEVGTDPWLQYMLNIPIKVPDWTNMTVKMCGLTYDAPAPPSGNGGMYPINPDYVVDGELVVEIKGDTIFTIRFDWW